MLTVLASTDSLQDVLDDCSFRPFGQARWEMRVEDIEDNPGLVEVNLEHWVADSRSFQHWDEFFESELKPQKFTRIVHRPEVGNEYDFVRDVIEMVAHCVAHEACEWFVKGMSCDIVYDPHEQGDPVVSIV